MKSLSTRLYRAILLSLKLQEMMSSAPPSFEDGEEEAAEGDAEATTRVVDPAISAMSSDDDDGPDPTTSTSRGLFEEVTRASPAAIHVNRC